MAGLGGTPKLSVQQQDSAIGDLFPALLSGERLIEQCNGHQDGEVVSLQAELMRCVLDIQRLLAEVEEGHSRQSRLDVDELEWMIDFLVKEVKDLGSRLRTALALARGGRVR